MPERVYYWYKALNITMDEDFLFISKEHIIAGYIKEPSDNTIYKDGLIDIGRGTKDWIKQFKQIQA